MIVRPHLGDPSTYWNYFTKLDIYKLEAVQPRLARFVLTVYDQRPTADLVITSRNLCNRIHCVCSIK